MIDNITSIDFNKLTNFLKIARDKFHNLSLKLEHV